MNLQYANFSWWLNCWLHGCSWRRLQFSESVGCCSMVPLGQGLASLGQVSNFRTVENDTRPGRSAACTLGKFLEKFVGRCQKDLWGLPFCFFFSKNQNCGSVFAANILRSCEEIEYCQAVPPDTTTDEGIPVWEVLGAISTSCVGITWSNEDMRLKSQDVMHTSGPFLVGFCLNDLSQRFSNNLTQTFNP